MTPMRGWSTVARQALNSTRWAPWSRTSRVGCARRSITTRPDGLADVPPLRILHVLAEVRYSGAEKMLFESIDAFVAHGIELTLVATGAQTGPLAKDFRRAGVQVEHIPFMPTA